MVGTEVTMVGTEVNLSWKGYETMNVTSISGTLPHHLPEMMLINIIISTLHTRICKGRTTHQPWVCPVEMSWFPSLSLESALCMDAGPPSLQVALNSVKRPSPEWAYQILTFASLLIRNWDLFLDRKTWIGTLQLKPFASRHTVHQMLTQASDGTRASLFTLLMHIGLSSAYITVHTDGGQSEPCGHYHDSAHIDTFSEGSTVHALSQMAWLSRGLGTVS